MVSFRSAASWRIASEMPLFTSAQTSFSFEMLSGAELPDEGDVCAASSVMAEPHR
jgi:hypothetical protein